MHPTAESSAPGFRPSLVIGLGGTGEKVLLKLRALLRSSYATARPMGIRYLYIDLALSMSTESTASDAPDVSFSKDEFLPLQVSDDVYSAMHHFDKHALSDLGPTMGRHIGSREFGRLAFAANKSKLTGHLTRLLNECASG